MCTRKLPVWGYWAMIQAIEPKPLIRSFVYFWCVQIMMIQSYIMYCIRSRRCQRGTPIRQGRSDVDSCLLQPDGSNTHSASKAHHMETSSAVLANSMPVNPPSSIFPLPISSSTVPSHVKRQSCGVTAGDFAFIACMR